MASSKGSGRYVEACPGELARWIEEEVGGPAKRSAVLKKAKLGRQTFDNWRCGRNQSARGTFERLAQVLGYDIEEIERLVNERQPWARCCKVDPRRPCAFRKEHEGEEPSEGANATRGAAPAVSPEGGSHGRPKVFLSYSQDTEAHRERVLALANRLREEGIDVELDQYVAHPPEGWPQWARRQIEESRFVLVVCTATYRRRFERKETLGRGATWEALIAEQLLYEAGGLNEKLIPILLDEGTEADVPLSLRAFARYHLPADYDDLYRHLTHQPKVLRPPLGTIRILEPKPGWPPPDFPDYRQLAFDRHRELELVGFDERVRVPIELNELYVPLDVVLDHGSRGRVIYSDAHHAKEHTEQYARCERITMAEAFGLAQRAGKRGKRGVVLLGDPGSGKTTQLRRVLLQLLAEPDDGGGPEAIGLPADTLPVFLPLRNLRHEESLSTFMQRELAGPLGKAPADLADRLVARGRLLWLFDGLDEVADEAERDRVARLLEDLLRDATDCWFLVSSRYAGYTPDIKLASGFLELHLRPLTDEQAKAFVENWYRVVEAEEARLDGVEPGPGRAAELLEELRVLERRGEAQLYEMTRNPLLLTAICLVHRRRSGALPEGREALYHECTTVLLERWRKQGKRMLPTAEARRVLQQVALWMHGEDGRTQATAEELRGPVRRGFEVIGKAGLDPDELLRGIRDESGLLTGWGLDRYGFMHLGFQEYLAALELRDAAEGQPQSAAMQKLAKRFGQTWWQEVILLMLAHHGMAAFERFMNALMSQPEFAAWTGSALMSRLLGQWTSEALAGLDELVLRHPASEVRIWWRRVRGLEQVARRTRKAPRGRVELVLVPGGRFWMGSPEEDARGFPEEYPQHEVELASFWLARTPVTNAQYGEYLRANPRAATPELWGSQEYNQPRQPVVGVSWKAAKEYCEWAGLRLPTEAQWEYACRAGTTTRYWSGDSEGDLVRVGWYGGHLFARLHAVGEKEPNGLGLYDMHGNVDEWCEDTWVDDYEGAVHRVGDGLRVRPIGDADRVARGGDRADGARHARSASRSFYNPRICSQFVGFRPALDHIE